MKKEDVLNTSFSFQVIEKRWYIEALLGFNALISSLPIFLRFVRYLGVYFKLPADSSSHFLKLFVIKSPALSSGL